MEDQAQLHCWEVCLLSEAHKGCRSWGQGFTTKRKRLLQHPPIHTSPHNHHTPFHPSLTKSMKHQEMLLFPMSMSKSTQYTIRQGLLMFHTILQIFCRFSLNIIYLFVQLNDLSFFTPFRPQCSSLHIFSEPLTAAAVNPRLQSAGL